MEVGLFLMIKYGNSISVAMITLNEEDSIRESIVICEELEKLEKRKLVFEDISILLDLQERACTIRLEHREKMREIFRRLKPLIEKLQISFIQS